MERQKRQAVLNDSATRTTIAYLFVHKYNGLEIVANDMMSNWHGRGGIIANIRRGLGEKSNSGMSIEPILMNVFFYEIQGIQSDPKSIEGRGGRRPPKFMLDSLEAEIIAKKLSKVCRFREHFFP